MKKHTRKGYRIGRTSALDYVLVVILGLMAQIGRASCRERVFRAVEVCGEGV